MIRRMLDTNTVSYLIRDDLRNAPPGDVQARAFFISAITEGELLFGVNRRPDATRLNALIEGFVRSVEIMPFDHAAAACYGELRAVMRRAGKALTSLDMLIAAHALSLGATLVTSDQAFRHVPGLAVEDWR